MLLLAFVNGEYAGLGKPMLSVLTEEMRRIGFEQAELTSRTDRCRE